MEKIKLVEQKLQKVFDEIANYFHEPYKAEFYEHCFFGGGCIYSTYNDLDPKDYDIFCEDIDLLNELKIFLIKHGLAEMITENAVLFGGGKYQLITKFYGKPMDVIGQFDFKHNLFGFYQGKVINAIGFDWLSTKFLRFNFDRARDIASSISRVPKFVSRGMICTRKEMCRMIEVLLTKTQLTDEIKAIQELINNRGY